MACRWRPGAIIWGIAVRYLVREIRPLANRSADPYASTPDRISDGDRMKVDLHLKKQKLPFSAEWMAGKMFGTVKTGKRFPVGLCFLLENLQPNWITTEGAAQKTRSARDLYKVDPQVCAGATPEDRRVSLLFKLLKIQQYAIAPCDHAHESQPPELAALSWHSRRQVLHYNTVRARCPSHPSQRRLSAQLNLTGCLSSCDRSMFLFGPSPSLAAIQRTRNNLANWHEARSFRQPRNHTVAFATAPGNTATNREPPRRTAHCERQAFNASFPPSTSSAPLKRTDNATLYLTLSSVLYACPAMTTVTRQTYRSPALEMLLSYRAPGQTVTMPGMLEWSYRLVGTPGPCRVGHVCTSVPSRSTRLDNVHSSRLNGDDYRSNVSIQHHDYWNWLLRYCHFVFAGYILLDFVTS
ncbi:hypothetical protein K474DRAFT_1697554 [Panus rudis PR-1116 ss-1]|nr:hypothetical protein K474DRAFT_1697554 [Panus rudis PR-1116 ss-1]